MGMWQTQFLLNSFTFALRILKTFIQVLRLELVLLLANKGENFKTGGLCKEKKKKKVGLGQTSSSTCKNFFFGIRCTFTLFFL